VCGRAIGLGNTRWEDEHDLERCYDVMMVLVSEKAWILIDIWASGV